MQRLLTSLGLQALGLIVLFLSATTAFALPAPAPMPPIELGATTRQVNLGTQVERWIDPTGQADLAQAQQRAAAGDFKALPGLPSTGFTLAAHWFRVRLAPQPTAPKHWVLAIGATYLNDVQVWTRTADSAWAHHQRGDRFTAEPRPFAARLNAVNLRLTPGQPAEIWVRVQTTSVMNVTLDLWQPDAYAGSETLAGMAYGGFVAVIALVVLVYAMLGLGLRDRVLLSYAGYMSTLAVLYFCNGGLLQMLLPIRPWWLSDILVSYGALGAFYIGNLMWVEVLELRRYFPRLAWVYYAASALVAVLLPLSATDFYSVMASAVYFAAWPLALCNLYAVVALWRRCRESINVIYVIVFSISSVGTWVILGVLLGWLPRNAWTVGFYPASTAIHIAMMSVAMVMRVIRVQRDKNEAQKASALATLHTENQRRFVAMLTHEFRNPLAGIDRAANLLQAMPDQRPEDVARRLGGIRTQVSRLGTLVDSFLLSEAADQKHLQPRLQTVDLQHTLHDLRQGLSAELRDRVEVQVEPAHLPARVDVSLLSLALHNLLDNALRYAPEGTPVGLQARIDVADPGWLLIEVSDHGPGLSADELALLGTPYYRASSAIGKQGTGLGYHFCRSLVQAQGGSIEAQPNGARGLRVTLRLPQDMLQDSPP